MDIYLTLKSLHIVFMVAWFAGLFYLPRLFVYFREAQDRDEGERLALQGQFSLMQRRLWYGITWPACVLTVLFGTSLLPHWFPLEENPWLVVKLFLVTALFLYHLSLGRIRKKLDKGDLWWTSTRLRIWNEIPLFLLVGIIFLVIFKKVAPASYGLGGMGLFFAFLLFLMNILKKFAKK